jgi:hypothetical protein
MARTVKHGINNINMHGTSHAWKITLVYSLPLLTWIVSSAVASCDESPLLLMYVTIFFFKEMS